MPNPVPQQFQPFNRVKDCRYGPMLYNFHDQYVGRSLDLYGEYSESEVALFRHLVRPGDVVVEVGANIGAHTIPLAKLTTSHGAVVAFEPQRIPFQALCGNVALNSLLHVFAHNAAVGNAPGRIKVPLLDPTQDQNFGGINLANQDAGEFVPVLTLDSLDLTNCRLLKVDVEGMELDVLHGAVNTIRKFSPALYVENDRADREAALTRYIASLGYDMFRHDAPLFNSDNFLHNPDNVFSRIASKNLLCVPKHTSHLITGLPRYSPSNPESTSI